ncbi:glycosyltransferase family 25 protein [Pseudomonas oryzihabitans]|uniref:glycosyltransferase family 25 protein n=1 Tax=Pseudomonas oryzihabitans TaxID=47885 RepID=UPI00147663C7|nr:glycosyltransferase family 25 protein [Pseudomonas oryzihabitans]NMZ66737.1 glycosyltransferase family 25 protein [Pseudomonas oryzihabitans]
MKSKTLKNLNVDGCLCINLENRTDRKELINKEFLESEINIEFVKAIADQNPERGCYESHRLCAQIAIERNYRRVLILEDDATLRSVRSYQISAINSTLKNKNPQILYLGIILGKLWLTWQPGIARCRGQGAHAYILSRDACETLLNTPFQNKAIDNFYSKNLRGYCALPMLCEQQGGGIVPSDINPSNYKTEAEKNFWKKNRRKQYIEALKHIDKTILRIDL